MAQTTSASTQSVAFKGRMMTLTVLEIGASDCDAIAEQVTRQVARAPDFFARMPVLVSFTAALPDLARLTTILRDADLVVVGVLDPEEAALSEIEAAGLGVLHSPGRNTEPLAPLEKKKEPAASQDRPEAASPREPEKPARTPTRLITRPIRSGQQIYARGGDLVVAASISEGAEVLADGHIHVYGALRGRALAGASGDTSARIFCRRFEPDLVAVAGCYKVADAIDEAIRSKAVVVRLENDHLLIELQE